MFTGLVKEIGIVKAIKPNREGKEFIIEARKLISDIEIDDSVAVNGACQTATKIEGNCFHMQTVHVSLDKTTLDTFQVGDEVNLELALTLQDRLGGHMVQGHVNDQGKVVKIKNEGKNYLLSIKVSNNQMKYIVQEGSITLDGTSLTVAHLDVENCILTASIIPHTWDNTILRNRKVGDKINIEVDVLAKYVENLLFHQGNNKQTSNITEQWLRSKGY